MNRARLLLGVAAMIAACGGPGANSPKGAGKDYATPFSLAMNAEATGEPADAIKQYLTIVDMAARAEGDPWQVPALHASLDALVARSVSSLTSATMDSALAYRTSRRAEIQKALAASYDVGLGPFAKGLIARALEELSVHDGDATVAEKWRLARGCAREATVTGPLSWTPLLGLKEADPLAKADAALDKDYATGDAFGTRIAPVVVSDRGCWIPLDAASTHLGVRDVVVDLDVPSAQTIGVALRSSSAAVLEVGGKSILTRPYELGGDDVAVFGTVGVGAGRVRLVLRVGDDDTGETVEVDAWDATGAPLAKHAPVVGERANAAATVEGGPLAIPLPKTDVERVLASAAALSANDGRDAEAWLIESAKNKDATVPMLLVYARALEAAQDLSLVHRQERMRAVYERILDAAPGAWEAVLEHAVLAGSRKGPGEARLITLGDLDTHSAKVSAPLRPLLDAFDASLSGREHIYDRAKAAFERAKAGLGDAAILRDTERVAFDRANDKTIALECVPGGRDSLACYSALKTAGRDADAFKEVERLRALRGAKADLSALVMRDALGKNDMTRAKQAWDSMLPGERSLESLAALRLGDRTLGKELLAMARTAHDAPASIPSLLRALGDDPTKDLDPQADAVVAKDRQKPLIEGAATAVLLHTERYDLAQDGTTHFVMLDVRRVSGTTDVEENAAASPPDLDGKITMRILRRRIYKKDGRVLEPERAPNAAQAHADLAQLEAGDAVMAIYEGWGVPGDTGDIGIDTPDLLPDRTAVVHASIEINMPATLKGALYSHPILGKPSDTSSNGVRTVRWSLDNRGTRRLEDGVPKMDRDVAVSFSTMDWARAAAGMRETLAGLEEREPEVIAFAKEAAQGKTGKELVAAVVDKVGETVRESNASLLSDVSFGSASGAQTTTARTIITDREGSRTWLIVRTLRELGIQTDVIVAENEPFSATPNFPPHLNRFAHPLAVAHVGRSGTNEAHNSTYSPGEDVWIDADVSGPPLPAGRTSPELRGRMTIAQDGTLAPMPDLNTDKTKERDEIDLRLVVDASGDAKGSLTILLRGREAQEVSEALFRVVGIERERALRGIALGWVPAANVDQVALSSSEGSWQVALRAEISAPGFAQQDGKQWVLPGIDPIHLVYPRPAVSTLGASYASQGGRQEALAISRAIQYHVHRRIELPAGSTVARAPGPLDLKTANLEASRKLTVAANVIEEEIALGISTGTVPPAQYDAFVQGAHKVDDAFLASIRVVAAK